MFCRMHLSLTLLVVWCTFGGFHVALGASVGKHNENTLQMISAIFRHGDRSPVYTYPNDPYLNYDWPGGLGSLSRKGVGQLYNLGKSLRHRYGHLLPKDGRYTQKNMFVRSSYAERCIMSAQSLLAGFMPPHEGSNPLPIAWQPVPITTVPKYEDELLSQYRRCKKYDNLLAEIRKNPPSDLKKMNEENKDLYEFLTKQTGKNITTFTDIENLYDVLKIQSDNKFILPDWTEDIFPARMLPFAQRDYSVFTETPYMKKIKGGAFVTEVYNTMTKKHAKTLKPDRKMFFYAAHDLTLVGILNSLGVLNQASLLPDYSAMIVFELHTNRAMGNDMEVKLSYYPNSATVEPKELTLPNCSSPCSLSMFGTAVKDLLIDDDFDRICENVQ